MWRLSSLGKLVPFSTIWCMPMRHRHASTHEKRGFILHLNLFISLNNLPFHICVKGEIGGKLLVKCQGHSDPSSSCCSSSKAMSWVIRQEEGWYLLAWSQVPNSSSQEYDCDHKDVQVQPMFDFVPRPLPGEERGAITVMRSCEWQAAKLVFFYLFCSTSI